MAPIQSSSLACRVRADQGLLKLVHMVVPFVFHGFDPLSVTMKLRVGSRAEWVALLGG